MFSIRLSLTPLSRQKAGSKLIKSSRLEGARPLFIVKFQIFGEKKRGIARSKILLIQAEAELAPQTVSQKD